MDPMTMRQTAKFPSLLAAVVQSTTYKPGWRFDLRDIDRGQGSEGLTLIIDVTGFDSKDGVTPNRTLHYMIVPAAAYDVRAWSRWVLDQIILVETHEACEYYKLNGHRPFAPNHGPGRNPYSILEKSTSQDARTQFTGEVR